MEEREEREEREREREQKRVEARERKEGREKERYDINRDEREEKEKALRWELRFEMNDERLKNAVEIEFLMRSNMSKSSLLMRYINRD